MQSITYIVSFGLHGLFFLAIMLLPTKVMIKRDKPLQISVTVGSIGGQSLPSPVLGQKAQEVIRAKAAPEALPALENKASAAPAAQVKASIAQAPPESSLAQPGANSLAAPIIKQSAEPLAKVAQPSAIEKPAPVLQKKEDVKKDSAVASKKDAKTQESKAVLNALASFKSASNVSGGGGGKERGQGGGGLNDVYAGLIMMAVQPNWSMPIYTRENLVVLVRARIDPQGKILSCDIERSSGRPDFDASAVNAVIRTKVVPPPPTLEQQEIIISFNALELAEH